MLKNAAVEYTMKWTLPTEAKIDMVGIRPREQQVKKGNGSMKMTTMKRRVVRELEPRKTSLEAQHPMSNMTPPTVSVVDERKQNTPSTTQQVMRGQPTASPNTSPQPAPLTL